tara:strand:- start:221 stop:421 length:201 start_codon:yes stop_codon:yes gene_type:complete
MNVLDEQLTELQELLKTNEHVKDKQVSQYAWDKYIKLLRYTARMSVKQALFMGRAKRILLGNKQWI